MDFIEVVKIIFLAVIEGITEWLPISSTGHMLLFDDLFPLSQSKAFKDVFVYTIQFGAVLAVVVLFWNKLFPLKRTGAGMHPNKKIAVDHSILRLWGKVIVACIPSLVGLFIDIPENPWWIAAMLIFYGVIFILVERKNQNRAFRVYSTEDISYKQALWIGAFQVLSILPGTSRSGITILGALLLGISRSASTEFTFFLAVPTMAGASLLKIFAYLCGGNTFTLGQLGYLAIGAICAFAVSLLVIRFLINFVKKHDFKIFGYYRIVLGCIVLASLALPML